jgi:hypothetical protein
MSLATTRMTTQLTEGHNKTESLAKLITETVLRLLIDDIRYLVYQAVDRSTKKLLDHRDPIIADHARSRRNALKKWMKSKNPLSWDLDGASGANYARLSLILCVDPGSDRLTLPLSKQPVTSDDIVKNMLEFAKPQILPKRRAPLTESGGCQYALPIGFTMIGKLIPGGSDDVKEYWGRHLKRMMRAMDISLVPWHQDTKAYAASINIWVYIRQIIGLPDRAPLTLEDRMALEAERIAKEDPDMPWDVPQRLADMKSLWKKKTLPKCWDISNASLPTTSGNADPLWPTYQFVCEKFDGSNWAHHLALIVAICFARVVPEICHDKNTTITASDPTTQIRNMAWIAAQSKSHRGTAAPRPFIVMMSTALIAFWDKRSPFSKHLIANNNSQGNTWTDKHGPKQIHALNFIRMGLADALSPTVKKHSLYKRNWCFKSDSQLQAIHAKFLKWLTQSDFGEYLVIEFLFGRRIALQLANDSQYIAPPF